MTATYDPNVWFDACRGTFAPLIRTQEECIKAVDRIARLQYAVAGDVLESSLAHARVALEAKSPGDYLAKSTELGVKLGDSAYSARGFGGQYIFVIPGSNLVVVHLHAKQIPHPEATLKELLQHIMAAAPWKVRRPGR